MTTRNQQYPREGFSLVELAVVMAILALLAALISGAVQKVRAAASRLQCSNNLRQQGLALHQFHDANRRFPAGARVLDGKDPYLYMTWQAQLLPFLEQQSLWQETEAAYRLRPRFWHVPPHVGLARPMPVLGCPADYRVDAPQTLDDGIPRALTSYLGNGGTRAFFQDGVLYADSAIRIGAVTDGTSNTLLVGERPASANMHFGWWYAGAGQNQDGEGDSVLGTRTKNVGSYAPDCPVGPYQYGPGNLKNQCDLFHFWSLHPGGAHFLFVDGSVHFLPYSANAVLPALGTRAGGEPVAAFD